MEPANGGRIVLRLISSEEPVRYEVELSTPDATHSSVASIDAAGSVTFAEYADGAPPAWLVQVARAMLRALFRAKVQNGWPRRITRWRAAPSGAPA
jgi:hypothetical protein